jgi:hypothetical protein
VRRLSGLTSGKSETICATRRCTVDESVSDTVRLRRTETLVELNVLVNDFSEPTTEPSDWHADEPKMDSRMDDRGHDLGDVVFDQVFSCPRECPRQDSNLR